MFKIIMCLIIFSFQKIKSPFPASAGGNKYRTKWFGGVYLWCVPPNKQNKKKAASVKVPFRGNTYRNKCCWGEFLWKRIENGNKMITSCSSRGVGRRWSILRVEKYRNYPAPENPTLAKYLLGRGSAARGQYGDYRQRRSRGYTDQRGRQGGQ